MDDDQFSGARWLAEMVGAYAAALSLPDYEAFLDKETQTQLVVNFQAWFLKTAAEADDDLILRLANPTEYAALLRRREDEHRMKMAERAAKLQGEG